MKSAQCTLRAPWRPEALDACAAITPDLVWVFGAVEALDDPALQRLLDERLAGIPRLGCSTAGEIDRDGVGDGGVVVTALRIGSGGLRVVEAPFAGMADSRTCGERLGRALDAPGLHDIIVFGQGVDINGSALIDGIVSMVGPTVHVSGGLAADGGRFERTLVVGPGGIRSDGAVALGISDPAVRVGHGSFGGWSPFGPVRTITRCEGNLLYELDGETALEIYRRYLGEYAADLPASGLLFPFAIVGADRSVQGLVRTILGIDEAAGSLTLAGDVPAGGMLQLMHASTDALVDGAHRAAEAASAMLGGREPGFALLVSCVGRKLMMGLRTEEEVESVADVLGRHAAVTGFYSNGEISPFVPDQRCRLHNQTMTVTCLHVE